MCQSLCEGEAPGQGQKKGTHSQLCSVFLQHSPGPSDFAPSHPYGLKNLLWLRRLRYPSTPLLRYSDFPWNHTVRRSRKSYSRPQYPQSPINRKKWTLPPSSAPFFMSNKTHCQKRSHSHHKSRVSHVKPISSLCSPFSPSNWEKLSTIIHTTDFYESKMVFHSLHSSLNTMCLLMISRKTARWHGPHHSPSP